MDIITAIGYIINTLKGKTNEIAKNKRFLIRKGKIEALTFVLALVISTTELHEITLKTILLKCEKIQPGLKISKQAIFKRMKMGSKLMEEIYINIFNEASKNIIKTDYIEGLNQFTDVYLTDATTISLPDKLKEVYKGMGGKNAVSAVKIQTTYSLLKQKITLLDITDATKNDTTYNKVIIEKIKPGELHIRDLGYYDSENFSNIIEKQAYFLSRIKVNTKLYKYNVKEKKYEEIDYCKLYKSADLEIDTEIFIKQKQGKMLRVRLVCIKLPEETISKRLQKAHKEAKSKGKALTKKERLMLRWNVFITNVSVEMLDAKQICKLYRLRWQLELVFKAIKSSFSFDNFGYAGEYYFKCLLYGKLIMLIMTSELFVMCRNKLYRKLNRLVSIQSFFRNVRTEIGDIIGVIKITSNNIINKFSAKLERIGELSLFEKRKRKSSEEELMSEYYQHIDNKELECVS